jgi:hypothetical protein
LIGTTPLLAEFDADGDLAVMLWRRAWPSVRGKVVRERDLGPSLGSGSGYDPVVAFRTLDGTEIEGSPRGGMDLGMPVVGREVPVWYDPLDPNRFEARINALDGAGSLPLLAAILPAVLFVVSFAT